MTCGFVVARGGVEPPTLQSSAVPIHAGQRPANANRAITRAITKLQRDLGNLAALPSKARSDSAMAISRSRRRRGPVQPRGTDRSPPGGRRITPVPSDGGDASPEVDLGDLVTRQHRGGRCPCPEDDRQAAPANTAVSSSASVVARPPERADEGDMPRLAGRRVHQASPRSRDGVRLD